MADTKKKMGFYRAAVKSRRRSLGKSLGEKSQPAEKFGGVLKNKTGKKKK